MNLHTSATRSTRRGTLALKAVVASVLTAGIALGTCGAAHAAPATDSTPISTTGAATVASTQGFNFTNLTADDLVFQHTTGDLPAPPSTTLTPGQTNNFQIDKPFTTHNTGDAIYTITSTTDGSTLGTFDLHLNSGDSFDGYSARGTFTDTNGNTISTMALEQPFSASPNYYAVDGVSNNGADVTIGSDSPAQQAAVEQYLAPYWLLASNPSFGDITETTGLTQPELVGEAYNGGTTTNQVGTGESWNYSTTDTWGTTASAGVEVGPVSAGVEASYSHSVTSGQSLTTNDTATNKPGTTEKIWAQFSQYIDNGTFTMTFNGVTYTLPNVTYYSAIPHAPAAYSTTTEKGNTLVNMPTNEIFN